MNICTNLTIWPRLDHVVNYYSYTFDLHHPQFDNKYATTLECNKAGFVILISVCYVLYGVTLNVKIIIFEWNFFMIVKKVTYTNCVQRHHYWYPVTQLCFEAILPQKLQLVNPIRHN
jgi:hypothetical protein